MSVLNDIACNVDDGEVDGAVLKYYGCWALRRVSCELLFLINGSSS